MSSGAGTSRQLDKDHVLKASTLDLARELGTDPGKGLTSSEAEERLRRYGPNDVPEKRRNPLTSFLRKFWGPGAWVLMAAAVMSGVLGKFLDLYVVIALLFVNAMISWLHEENANRALELLKSKLQVQSRVLRDGEWKQLPARLLVPGDVVRIRLGDFVPADVKLATGEVEVDESALTGESLPLRKGPNDLVYSGSVVRRGEATGIVALTGINTYFGRTTELVKIAKPRPRVAAVVNKITLWMAAVALVLIALLGVTSAIRGQNVVEDLPLFLVLILAAIPIALPAMFSVSMAIGARQLADSGALVTKLEAIEGGATMDVLVSDKTGTLTVNQLTVKDVIPAAVDEDTVILYGALASQEANQDPIDLAFISEAKRRGLDITKCQQKSFTPFDPTTRRTEAIVVCGDREMTVAKGALEVISSLHGKDATPMAAPLAAKGERVLAVAYRENGSWQLAGLVGIRDPPRPDTPKLIEELRKLGVKVKMLTGDNMAVARSIASEIGLGEKVIRMSEVKEATQNDAVAAAAMVEEADGFAEAYPEDKFTLVRGLQGRGHVVGMTGDGVNDAPALRQADVGIAVSNATDVAKGAAAVVLTKPGLSNIVSLVKIGRQVYERVATWILSRLSRLFQNVIFVALAAIIFGLYVINALGMLLLLFMFDFVTLTQATDYVGWWSGKPVSWHIGDFMKVSGAIGVAMIVEAFAATFAGLRWFGVTQANLPTFGFLFLLYSNIFTLLNVRERRNFWRSMPSRTMLIAMSADIAAAAAITYFGLPELPALPPVAIAFALLFSALLFLVANNFLKVQLFKRIII
ncbi:MAG: plasma-membrane proton-efflux P-type ATPase [Conexivisphaera sp.]|jgi:H+-transporting ATPase